MMQKINSRCVVFILCISTGLCTAAQQEIKQQYDINVLIQAACEEWKKIEAEEQHQTTITDNSVVLGKRYCDECPFSTMYDGRLSSHYKMHKKKRKKLTVYRCKGCNYLTDHKNAFELHMRRDLPRCSTQPYTRKLKYTMSQYMALGLKKTPIKI